MGKYSRKEYKSIRRSEWCSLKGKAQKIFDITLPLDTAIYEDLETKMVYLQSNHTQFLREKCANVEAPVTKDYNESIICMGKEMSLEFKSEIDVERFCNLCGKIGIQREF